MVLRSGGHEGRLPFIQLLPLDLTLVTRCSEMGCSCEIIKQNSMATAPGAVVRPTLDEDTGWLLDIA